MEFWKCFTGSGASSQLHVQQFKYLRIMNTKKKKKIVPVYLGENNFGDILVLILYFGTSGKIIQNF